jgi:hypothetical protein
MDRLVTDGIARHSFATPVRYALFGIAMVLVVLGGATDADWIVSTAVAFLVGAGAIDAFQRDRWILSATQAAIAVAIGALAIISKV